MTLQTLIAPFRSFSGEKLVAPALWLASLILLILQSA